jgi:hypothetical protein
LSLDNSTVAVNQARGSEGGQGGKGGDGIPLGTVGQTGVPDFGNGGGLWAPSAPGHYFSVVSVSSLFASNTTDLPEFQDVNAMLSAADTLVQEGFGAGGIVNGIAGNLVGVDPRLGPLQDNGGPTPTMALLLGSPAIDAGSNPLNLPTDQRGDPRVVGAGADIGAYEFGANGPPGVGGGGTGGGGTGGGESRGGDGGGGGAVTVPILAAVIKVKHRRAIRVTDPATGGVKFTVFPFSKGYHGRFTIATVTVDGVEDLVARRPKGRHKFLTAVFSGIDGSPLPSSLA